MKLVSCDKRHATAILAILNEAILNSTALYDYKPRTPQMMDEWLAEKAKGRYPMIGMEDEAGVLLGFATYGPFRARPAYKYSIEHSVYVEKGFRGRGVGVALMRELIERAKGQGYHMMIGGIDAENDGSIRFHKRLGFSHCASIKEAGFKCGRWLDLEFYQLVLPTPADPADG
jgi:phosphinothricin acetyltransferase